MDSHCIILVRENLANCTPFPKICSSIIFPSMPSSFSFLLAIGRKLIFGWLALNFGIKAIGSGEAGEALAEPV